ncbi:MAG: hypothetical protein EOP09_08670 [Proteobacteria bacterium]|nr:MAG: hypothetical protein EOP09_08670 [Pseudomonadota bacterium]
MEQRRGLLFAFACIQGLGLALLAWVISVAHAREGGGIQNRALFVQDREVRVISGRLSCPSSATNTGQACDLRLITDASPSGIALPHQANLYQKFYSGEDQVRMLARFSGRKIESVSLLDTE